MASPATSIPDTQLGLTSAEIGLLRQHQSVALQTAGTSSSAAASRASSQGRLLLDPGSLQALSYHFDRLMSAIQGRLQQLTQQTQLSVQRQANLASMTAAQADAEIARFHAILKQIDELEVEFDKVRHIRDIVRSFRSRVEGLERRL